MAKIITISPILGQLPHKHKLVIAGNHELSFDHTFTNPIQSKSNADRCMHTGNYSLRVIIVSFLL